MQSASLPTVAKSPRRGGRGLPATPPRATTAFVELSPSPSPPPVKKPVDSAAVQCVCVLKVALVRRHPHHAAGNRRVNQQLAHARSLLHTGSTSPESESDDEGSEPCRNCNDVGRPMNGRCRCQRTCRTGCRFRPSISTKCSSFRSKRCVAVVCFWEQRHGLFTPVGRWTSSARC